MLFKSRELSQVIRPSEFQGINDSSRIPPKPLEIRMELQDIMVSDVTTDEDLITNMKDQWKIFFFQDLKFFSWSNFLSTIKIFIYGSSNGTEILSQIIKQELRFQLKELKTNNQTRDVFQKLNAFFQRIFLLNKHLSENFPLTSIVLPIVHEELNNLQSFWEVNYKVLFQNIHLL